MSPHSGPSTTNDWTQLNLRLDEQFAHLHERLDALQSALREMEDTFQAKLAEHAAYHQANEPHWGPERLAQRHPFRTALAAVAGTWVLFFAAPHAAAALGQALLRLLLQAQH